MSSRPCKRWTACAAPFTFSTTVESSNSNARSSFEIDLVSQDLTEALSVQGNLDPFSPGYGIWTSNSLTPVGTDKLVGAPTPNGIYTVTVTVDAVWFSHGHRHWPGERWPAGYRPTGYRPGYRPVGQSWGRSAG